MTGPEELNGIFAFLTVPPTAPFPEQYQLKKMCAVVWCYSGTQEKAEQVFKPIRDFRTPAIDLAGPIPFPVLQSLFDVFYPAGLQWYWKARFFNQYEDHAIDQIIKNGKLLPTPLSFSHIFPVNGAVSRVGNQETAWGYRNANFMQVIGGVDPDPANNERIIKWVKDFDKDILSYSQGGVYVNMIMDEGLQGVKAAYGDNYMRLAQIKAKYDPNNLFHINQNILPKA